MIAYSSAGHTDAQVTVCVCVLRVSDTRSVREGVRREVARKYYYASLELLALPAINFDVDSKRGRERLSSYALRYAHISLERFVSHRCIGIQRAAQHSRGNVHVCHTTRSSLE